jgi:hypothetical protein
VGCAFALAFCALCLVTAGALWPASASLAVVPLVLGIAAAGLGALGAGLAYCLVVLPADRDLAAFRRSQYLAHWTYEAEDWARFAQAERGRFLPFWILSICSSSLGAFAAGAVFIGLFWWGDPTATIPAMVLGGAILALFCGGSALLRGYPEWRFLRPVPPTRPEVYIGPESVYFLPQGRYRRQGFRFWVALRTVSETLSVLEFTVRRRNALQFRVPVPAGKEEEAEALVARLEKERRRRWW